MIEKELPIFFDFKGSKPFSGNFIQKYSKFEKLVHDLCSLYEIESPVLKIDLRSKKGKKSKTDGFIKFSEKTVRIKGFSIMTLLHEIKHWIDFQLGYLWDDLKENKKKEWAAIYYSTFRYYKMWPEKLKCLQEIQNLSSRKNVSIFFDEDEYSSDPHALAIVHLALGNKKCLF